MTTEKQIHCTNESCPRRDTCAKGGEIQDGNRTVYYHSPIYSNCPEYTCRHPVRRQFHSYGFEQCHHCLVKIPYATTARLA